MRSRVFVFLAFGLLVAGSGPADAFQEKRRESRFDVLALPDPAMTLPSTTVPLESLPPSHPLRSGWSGFRTQHGPGWEIHLDPRSGAPSLVQGQGIPWIPGSGNRLADPAPVTLELLEASLRRFAGANRHLLLADDSELVLDREASGRLTPDVWQVVFERRVAGIVVEGDRYLFTIGQGNLVSFGASRWSRIETSATPDLDSAAGLHLLLAYMGLHGTGELRLLDAGSLRFVPSAATGPDSDRSGAGYGPAALVWRFAVAVQGEPGTWVGYVDAHSGEIRALFDDDRYAQAKGGVYPVSDDQFCPDGCEQPSYPMPYADLTIGGATATASTMGMFDCQPGGATATTTLAGPYVRVQDSCGAISESIACDGDLDLRSGTGTDCAVPPGSSPGNTHASRTGFYHLNRIAEHARHWLPSNTWLQQQLTDNVNISSTCNAYWNGSVNFYRSGGGCNNTGEIAGVFLHEWGHGLDQNDGGGYDNPSEAYADITSFLATHVSCNGRGFFQSRNCDGYGNACLDCTGIRDDDWDRRANHVPSTPAGFLASYCPSGSGPCGKETHCESYVGAETLWDLAARDLPAAGLDPDTAWQLTDKLWYRSRAGSGGNAYTCSIPSSDGCGATSWFAKLRAIDDDDGNLANGTPHAAAIYAAFARHAIACGSASDPSNRDSSSCPSISAATLSGLAGTGAAALSWTQVAGAASYDVLRNEAGCSAGYTVVATVPAPETTYTDSGLANGFAEYYRVQASGSNAACGGPVSNCVSVTPQPFAGTIALDHAVYGCASVITVSVTDGNIDGDTTTATLRSGTETSEETVTLTRVAPGSARYAGTIATTPAPPASDGLLSLSHGDTITARYVDADDGLGNSGVIRETTATADCQPPLISDIHSAGVTGSSATIAWTTDEVASSTVHYGLTTPPGSTSSSTALVTGHAVTLTGLAECSTYRYSVASTDVAANSALDDGGGAYYSFATGKNDLTAYPSSGGPIPIPDSDPTGATSTISVPDDKSVTDVNVTVNITHTYDGDLTLYLIPPAGATITLASRRGGGGNDFRDTVFDDEASTPISAGSPPFTGSFRPESPLSSADGIRSLGEWKLKVVDGADVDTGTIDGWTLTISYPPGSCGPHALYSSHALVEDVCPPGGAGSGDSVWDAGESVQFSVTIRNDGTVPLTGVAATVTPVTPGITMAQPTASFDVLPPDTSGTSLAPHFTAQLPAGVACGSLLDFAVSITSNEGSWSGTFSQVAGRPYTGSGTVLDERFDGGIPSSWTVVDGGSGGGAASTWTTSNPGGRTIAAPMSDPVAIVDSDSAGSSATQDEELITPPLDLSGATGATLEFDQYFEWYSGGTDEVADVDVRSSLTGQAWVNVLRQRGASSPNPDHRTIDISAQAAGAPDVRVRFHYYDATFEWYWQVDNVRVSYSAPGGCAMTACGATAAAARPVPDGSFGSPMTCSRLDAEGSAIDVSWDVSTCASADHHILWGSLAGLASLSIDGSACGLGTSGHGTWSGVPAVDLWFVVVGNDGAGTEGTWGTDSTGAPRGGSSASGQCGNDTRDNDTTCP